MSILEKHGGDKKGQRLDTVKGIIAAVVIVILFASSATAVQLLERRIPDMELNTFRSAAPFVMSAILTLIPRELPLIGRDEILATVLYTVDIFIAALFYFVAISMLPAAVAACVAYTSMMISALFIFSLCWNEKITTRNVMFALISVPGVVMVIQPWQPNSDNVTNTVLFVNGSFPSEENVPAYIAGDLTNLTVANGTENVKND